MDERSVDERGDLRPPPALPSVEVRARSGISSRAMLERLLWADLLRTTVASWGRCSISMKRPCAWPPRRLIIDLPPPSSPEVSTLSRMLMMGTSASSWLSRESPTAMKRRVVLRCALCASALSISRRIWSLVEPTEAPRECDFFWITLASLSCSCRLRMFVFHLAFCFWSGSAKRNTLLRSCVRSSTCFRSAVSATSTSETSLRKKRCTSLNLAFFFSFRPTSRRSLHRKRYFCFRSGSDVTSASRMYRLCGSARLSILPTNLFWRRRTLLMRSNSFLRSFT
mmetsp:Transcript_18284/g.70640  ORF Transcript_18284/g.70640 Transcript_18284/m.70640 type:complete len:282 (-) Transcript_18284:785-1630(-)